MWNTGSPIHGGWVDDSAFIVRENSITECVLVIPLLEDTFASNGFGGEETEGVIFQRWGIALGVLVDVFFNISEDNNA